MDDFRCLYRGSGFILRGVWGRCKITDLSVLLGKRGCRHRGKCLDRHLFRGMTFSEGLAGMVQLDYYRLRFICRLAFCLSLSLNFS